MLPIERRLAERRARGEVIPIPNKDVYRDPDEVDDEDSLNPDGVNEEEGDAACRSREWAREVCSAASSTP